MSAIPETSGRPRLNGRDRLPVIDADVHPWAFPPDVDLCKHMSQRWRTYVETFGLRSIAGATQTPQQQPNAARRDAFPANGGDAGSDPEFAREQLLDPYNIDAAILLPFGGLGACATGNEPTALVRELSSAYNDWCHERWLESDSRWRGSICLPYEQPDAAVKEIERTLNRSERFVQLLISCRTEHPAGNPKYWPIFEAAAHYDIPVAYHVGVSRTSQSTACGMPSYYFEEHVGIAQQSWSLVSSLVFEGVFERFPTLKVVIAELGWSWAVPMSWRMDASWRMLRSEVPHLQRKPSEYFSANVWFTSQPMEEPPRPEWFQALYAQFERAGFGDKLMFSSDYPHWDFDSPDEALPTWLSQETKGKILAGNASALYGIPVGSMEE